MKTFLFRVGILTALAALALAAAFQGVNPNEVLKQITELRKTRSEEAIKAGKPVDARALQAEVVAKAKEAVVGVDVSKIEAKDGHAWAQLFQTAGDFKNACDAAAKFVDTNPGAQEKYSAQVLMLGCCNSMGEADMVVKLLGEIQPAAPLHNLQLASLIAGSYSETVRKKKGGAAALPLLDQAEQLVAKSPQGTQQEKDRAESVLGKIRSKRNSIALYDKPGTPAPPLTVERTIGDFKGLDAYKGRIVLLKFYAHW